jgi:hypothetical protein
MSNPLRAIGLTVVLMAATAGATGTRPFHGEASLATPLAAAKQLTLEGVTWACDGSKCIGTANTWSTLDSHMKECRKVSSALGPLTSYRSRGRTLSAQQVATCNRSG